MQGKISTIFFFLFGVCIAQDDENCPKFVKWKRNTQVTRVNYLILPIRYVIIHHTLTMECNNRAQCVTRVENIYSFHVNDRGLNDIGYSFLIGGDGSVYEGRGWNREGAHTSGYNKKSIGIAFIGNYEEGTVSEKMLEAAHKLILCGKSQGILQNDVRVMGARQVVSTVNPGYLLYEQIKNWPEWISGPDKLRSVRTMCEVFQCQDR